MPKRVLILFGTRPEAIKLAPVVLELQRDPRFEPLVCVTAQHREMLDQVLRAFAIEPRWDLNLMRPGQSLTGLTGRMISALEEVFQQAQPDWAIVQGDTTTTFCGALAAFYHRVPLAHVEAGLRTGDLAQPFPEEANRVLTGRLATLHFAATAQSRDNLLREHAPAAHIEVTGNTGIDAVLLMRDRIRSGQQTAQLPQLQADRKIIAVTAHRRESFGEGIESICRALARLAQRDDVHIVFPVHPNPNVRQVVERLLTPSPSLTLLEPLDYVPFVALMDRAHFLISDSGGVQEEAPALGRPVLVLREKTERPEGVDAGSAKLVGTSESRIVEEATRLLEDPAEFARMAEPRFVYGDGQASRRIANRLA